MQHASLKRNILIVQNGDFRDAWARFSAGEAERYRDQKRSVDFVSDLSAEGRVTTSAFGPQRYRAQLAPDLWAEGLGRQVAAADIRQVFDAADPTHVILRTPHRGFLREARKRGLWVLPCFADTFSAGSLRKKLRNLLLRRDLMRLRAPCIANHSLNASRSLVDVLGISAGFVVPWDWSKVPLAGGAKAGLADPERPQLFFAGSMTGEKGVGDCLEALSLLKAEGISCQMAFAGPGELGPWQDLSEKLGIADRVRFLGRISNADVRREMRAHDFVLVPSRHSYPEGLPNTIYEALASRSVLLISDHPAFAGRLQPDSQALVFAAANPGALANSLRRAIGTPGLYEKLSANAAEAHDSLYLGLEWTALVTAFLEDPANKGGWVEKNALAAL